MKRMPTVGFKRRKPLTGAAALARKRRVAILPALFTLANGVFGFASIIVASRIHPSTLVEGGEGYADAVQFLGIAGWLIFAGMACDALDGRMARLSGAATRFGAELDSLCDAITFGAAPAFLLLKLGPTAAQPLLYKVVFVASIAYVICTILRLARFNIETTEEEESHRFFKGLPSPAAAGCIAAVATTRHDLEVYSALMHSEALGVVLRSLLPFLAIALALLMVSTIPYPHLVNQNLRGKRPFNHLVQLIALAMVAAIFQELALVAAFWAFAFLGPLRRALKDPRALAKELGLAAAPAAEPRSAPPAERPAPHAPDASRSAPTTLGSE